MKLIADNPKLIGLIFIIIPLLVIAIPVTNTFKAWTKYNLLHSKVARLRNTNINTKSIQYDTAKIQHSFDVLSLSGHAGHVTIRQIETPKAVVMGNVIVHTQQITMEGGFEKLMRTLQAFEMQLQTVKIASLKFETQEKNKTLHLLAYVTFQYVEPLTREK